MGAESERCDYTKSAARPSEGEEGSQKMMLYLPDTAASDLTLARVGCAPRRHSYKATSFMVKAFWIEACRNVTRHDVQ